MICAQRRVGSLLPMVVRIDSSPISEAAPRVAHRRRRAVLWLLAVSLGVCLAAVFVATRAELSVDALLRNGRAALHHGNLAVALEKGQRAVRRAPSSLP